jgi:L-threonylcarbamoyladenylate synthase
VSTHPLVTADVELVARLLGSGGLVGMPTETVYGLAADAGDVSAVARVFAVKGRPADHPLIVHLADVEDLATWAQSVPAYARRLAERLWPGPLTLVLPRTPQAGDHVTGGLPTVALRVPAHPVARRLLTRYGRGLAAPSANRFGRVSPTTAAHVVEELGDLLVPGQDAVLEGGPSVVGVESAIVDCTGPAPVILRPGAVTATDVTRVGGVAVTSRSSGVRAPGTLASHYAPRARVELVDDAAALLELLRRPEAVRAENRATVVSRTGSTAPTTAGAAGSATPPKTRLKTAPTTVEAAGIAPAPVDGLLAPATVATPPGLVRLSEPVDAAGYARVLYAALREADALGLTRVLAVPPPAEGMGAAVQDRLRRAAAAG